MKRFDIYRSNPNDPEDRPKYVSYYIDQQKCGPMFLDALIKIKDEIDPTLSFRRSCREGICGSCAMNIDGRHHLACLCAIPKGNQEKSTVSPLMFMFVLKDLVTDMSHFYAQYKSIDPFLKRKKRSCSKNQFERSPIRIQRSLDHELKFKVLKPITYVN